MPDEDPSLVHGLSNLNLLDQLQDGTTQPTVDAIKSKAAPALAGIDHVLDALREVIGWPVIYAEEAAALGVRWPRGILLHGPPGVGKSAAVAAVAAEFDASVHLITAGRIVGAFMGESERKLREAFDAAHKEASQTGRPVVIFLDDVDSLCPRRMPGQQHEARLVGQLLTLLDGAEAGARRDAASSSFQKQKHTQQAPDILSPSASVSATPSTKKQSSTMDASTHQPSQATPSQPLTKDPEPAAERAETSLTPRPCASANAALPGVTPPFFSIPGHVVVIAATSRPNALDPALRRPGRIDREIAVPVPDAKGRRQILELLAPRLPFELAPDIDLELVAQRCHGYTGADVWALCREAALEASQSTPGIRTNAASPAADEPPTREMVAAEERPHVRGQTDLTTSTSTSAASSTNGSSSTTDNDGGSDDKTRDKGGPPQITTLHFLHAMDSVGPSVARSVAATFPSASWDDLGGLEDIKRRLKQAVEWPITRAAAFRRLGIKPPRGVLLHGPPGCAKTTLARAAATASGATFIPLQGASLYSMYVGEGEAELRESFRKARLAAPAIVFIDELDMLVGSRGGAGGGGSSRSGGGGNGGEGDASARLLSTFLNELDGMELAEGVMVLATTNRPGAIDDALLRPGRFDLVVYVPPPDTQGRFATLRVHTRRMPLAQDVDLHSIAQRTERFTGAELAAVCREAAMAALREDMQGAEVVAARHFHAAVDGISPMLTEETLERYAAWPPKRGRGVSASFSFSKVEVES